MSRKICYSVQASALQFQQVMSMYVMHSGLGLKQDAPGPLFKKWTQHIKNLDIRITENMLNDIQATHFSGCINGRLQNDITKTV